MKKIFLFITIVAATISMSSCSDDDTPEKDSIVGQWKIYQIIVNSIPIPVDDSECELQGVLEFKSDNSFSIEEYSENGTGECVLEEINVGTWSNNGNGMYGITIEGETEEAEVMFENNTFSITETEGDITYKIVYKRI